MSSEFREKIKKSYLKDKRWKEIIKQLRRIREAKITRISFHLDDELIYYINPNDYRHRLYISKSLEKDIF